MSDKKSDYKIVNRVLLWLNISMYLLFIVRWEGFSYKFLEVYQQFELELPLLSRFVMSGFRVFLLVLVLLIIAKEFLKNKKTVFIINAVALTIPLLFIILGFIGIFLPLFKLANVGS